MIFPPSCFSSSQLLSLSLSLRVKLALFRPPPIKPLSPLRVRRRGGKDLDLDGCLDCFTTALEWRLGRLRTDWCACPHSLPHKRLERRRREGNDVTVTVLCLTEVEAGGGRVSRKVSQGLFPPSFWSSPFPFLLLLLLLLLLMPLLSEPPYVTCSILHFSKAPRRLFPVLSLVVGALVEVSAKECPPTRTREQT